MKHTQLTIQFGRDWNWTPNHSRTTGCLISNCFFFRTQLFHLRNKFLMFDIHFHILIYSRHRHFMVYHHFLTLHKLVFRSRANVRSSWASGSILLNFFSCNFIFRLFITQPVWFHSSTFWPRNTWKKSKTASKNKNWLPLWAGISQKWNFYWQEP